MSGCTAPIEGHKPGSGTKCPVHGRGRGGRVRAQRLAAPALTPAIVHLPATATECEALSRDPRTPTETLVALAEHPHPSVVDGVAFHPSTPPETLAKFVEDGRDGLVLTGVAGNPSASPETLRVLARNEEEGVRMCVAANPSAPPEALTVLASDSEVFVRTNVRANPSTPAHVLLRWANDPDESVRAGAARNPSTPVHVLVRWANDPAAGKRVHRSVAENPSTPPESLSVLAGSSHISVRCNVAENPSISTETLARLIADEDADVRQATAPMVDVRLCALLDIDEGNTGAIELLRDERWWEIGPDHPALVVARALHPNA